jgi:drug/metabolite transporter (DMT)-like permease
VVRADQALLIAAGAIEVAVGAAVRCLEVLLRSGPARAARRWRYGRLGLVAPALTFALFDFGIDRTGAAEAAVLVAAQSIFAVGLSWLVLRERTTARVGAADALGFAGVASWARTDRDTARASAATSWSLPGPPRPP